MSDEFIFLQVIPSPQEILHLPLSKRPSLPSESPTSRRLVKQRALHLTREHYT